MDISETDNEYRISCDLPGFKKVSVFVFTSIRGSIDLTTSFLQLPKSAQEDINITLDEDVLTIAANRSEEHDENTTNWHVRERRFGRVQRSIRLPKSADHDSIRAQHDNGTLRVCIDKKKEKQPTKQIDIASHDYPFAK